MTNKEETWRWKYVYCVIPTVSERCFGNIGLNEEEVYTLHYKDLAAVVSNSMEDEYEVLDWGVPHQKVVEEVGKAFQLLPMAFGHVATEEDVKAFLSENYYKLKHTLAELEGKVELGIKAMWKMDDNKNYYILREIIASNQGIRMMNKQISSKPKDSTYKLRMELGRRVEEELQKRGRRIATAINQKLGALSVARKENALLSEEMILNASFLVSQEKEKEFDARVNAIEEEYKKVVDIKYVTAPPYNFVELKIKG